MSHAVPKSINQSTESDYNYKKNPKRKINKKGRSTSQNLKIEIPMESKKKNNESEFI